MVQNWGVFFLFAVNLTYGLLEFYDRIFFTAFQITFFTFLLGRTVSNMLTGHESTDYNFSMGIISHTNICLGIALVSLLFGYVVANYLKQNHDLKREYVLERDTENCLDYDSPLYVSVRTVSMWAFFATFPFDILVAVEKYIFVKSMGYAAYYTSYASQFPYVIIKLADSCVIAFYIFLATFPSKKNVRIPIILYLIHAVVSLGTGKRTELIVPLFLLILYFCVRNKIRRGDSPWITGRSFMIILILVPFLLAAMFTYNTTRFSTSSTETDTSASTEFVEKIAGFFEEIGFSVNVISFEKYYEAEIPDKVYSFGDTVDYLRENVLTQLFFDFPVYKTQTVEKALYGNNFSQTITYIRSESYYLSGRGYGSSYIAEAYHDFGYLGVSFWSIMYAFFLAFMYDYKNKGIIYVTLSLCALRYILIAPRNMASAFISEIINVNVWFVIVGVFGISWFISYFKRKRA
jgi:oligosaccharide repeat unit polymerase